MKFIRRRHGTAWNNWYIVPLVTVCSALVSMHVPEVLLLVTRKRDDMHCVTCMPTV